MRQTMANSSTLSNGVFASPDDIANVPTTPQALPDGHDIRYLVEDDINTLAADPEVQLPAATLTSAFERGDLCLATFYAKANSASEALVGYNFYTHVATPVNDEVRCW